MSRRVKILLTSAATMAMLATLVVTPAIAGPADPVLWIDAESTRVNLTPETANGTRTLIDLPPVNENDYVLPLATWSPDGKQVAIVFSGGRCCELLVIDIESGTRTRVASDANAASPSFSPDSSSLVYANIHGDLTVVGLDTGTRRTVSLPEDIYATFEVDWSPDGQRFAFLHSYYEEMADLYVVRTDGTGLVAITDGEDHADASGIPDSSRGSAGSFSWAPDGRRLVYSRGTGDMSGGPASDLWVASATGGTKTRITTASGHGHSAASWSPRGDLIAYTDGLDIYTVRPDGSDRQVFADVQSELYPVSLSWAPEQEAIAVVAFTSDWTAHDVYIAEPGRAKLFRLTHTGGGYVGEFSPIPSRPVAPVRAVDDSCPAGEVPEDGFSDVPESHPHEANIDCAVWWELTGGVGPNRYAPGAGVTRGQMTTFIANLIVATGRELPADPPDAFRDDNGTTHEANINRLAEAGVVQGTGPDTFSPDTYVLRAQMATFLAAAYEYVTGELLPTGNDFFYDDEGMGHQGNINRVALAGLAAGVERGRYEPRGTVTRAQMATFLVRLLDLLVEQGHATRPS